MQNCCGTNPRSLLLLLEEEEDYFKARQKRLLRERTNYRFKSGPNPSSTGPLLRHLQNTAFVKSALVDLQNLEVETQATGKMVRLVLTGTFLVLYRSCSQSPVISFLFHTPALSVASIQVLPYGTRGLRNKTKSNKDNTAHTNAITTSSKRTAAPKEQKQSKQQPTRSNPSNAGTVGNGNPPLNTAASNESPSSPMTSSSAFSQLELQDLRESFATFDMHGQGRINCGDLRNILQTLYDEAQTNYNEQTGGMNNVPSPNVMYPHLQQVLTVLQETKNDTDSMDLQEYISLMECTTLQHRMRVEQQRQQENGTDHGNNFRHVFQLFDLDQKGYITVDDLERVAKDLGEYDMSIDEFHEMIDRAQQKDNSDDGNDRTATNSVKGRVTLEEFTNIMTTKLYNSRSGKYDEQEKELGRLLAKEKEWQERERQRDGKGEDTHATEQAVVTTD